MIKQLNEQQQQDVAGGNGDVSMLSSSFAYSSVLDSAIVIGSYTSFDWDGDWCGTRPRPFPIPPRGPWN